MESQDSINAVSALQDAFKENGIETRKLPRAAALRVSFMGAFHRVVYAGENKGWLVSGYNEDGDPVKISELQSLCEEISPVAIPPVAEEAISNSEPAKPEPAQAEDLASDEAAPNPEPGQGEELRQLQSAIKGIEGTTYCNKAPRQNGLLFDFQKEQYRVDAEENGWVVKLVFGSGQHLEHLQKLILSLSTPGEEVEIFTPGEEIEEDAIGENPGIDPADLCQSLNDNFQSQGLIAKPVTRDLISITFQGKEFSAMRKPCDPSDWYVDGGAVLGPSLRFETVKKALYQILQIFWDDEDEIDTPGEEIEEDAIAPPSSEPNTITGKAVTLQQPWAWAITHLGKNIENRVWPTNHRGEIYIHAGRGWDASGAAWIEQNFNVKVPPQSQMAAGELVAKCNLVECLPWSKSREGDHPSKGYRSRPWGIDFGYHWILENIEVLKTPIPLRGKLGIFPFSVVNPEVMDPCDIDSNAWCVANSPIAEDEIDDLGVPGTQAGSFTMLPTQLPTQEDETAVKRRHLIKRIYTLASRTGVRIDGDSGLTLRDPEECPMADLEKICNQLLTLPPISDGIEWWRSHQDDDHGEPINYRPSAEMAS